MLDSMRSPGESEVQIEERRKKVLVAVAKIMTIEAGNLSGEERLEGLPKWDSLAALDFLLEMERQFNAEISPESLERCDTVEDLVNIVVGSSFTKGELRP